MSRITFTVTNDLTYDQRMIRICNSLCTLGYEVELIGVKRNHSIPLKDNSFKQKRLSVFFQTGFAFYLEYNIRLFFYLMFSKSNILCCIDLDTILPVYYASVLKNKIRVYDAHEYFSQQKEIITRPKIYKVWHFIERHFVPKFRNGYTVAESISEEFKKLYGVNYEVIRNVPWLKPFIQSEIKTKNILYQGSVNEARGFEFVIPAMKQVEATLEIYGDGNFLEQTRQLIDENRLEQKVFLQGKVAPSALDEVTERSYIGINLVEPLGLNQYYSLANKFFDYIQHGVPQITMDFPEYRRVNDEFEVALLIEKLSVESIANAINELLINEELYRKLQANCMMAREKNNWQLEEEKLKYFYANILKVTSKQMIDSLNI